MGRSGRNERQNSGERIDPVTRAKHAITERTRCHAEVFLECYVSCCEMEASSVDLISLQFSLLKIYIVKDSFSTYRLAVGVCTCFDLLLEKALRMTTEQGTDLQVYMYR